MFRKFLSTAEGKYRAGERFAIAFVVNRQVPSSGKPGDKAVIHRDGTVSGWIGGGCTRGIVLKEAMEAMQDGRPRLVRISPSGDEEDMPGVKSYRMTCHSGGMVEVYIEPVMPKPHIFIAGKSQIAQAVCRLALAMDYSVTAVSKGADEGVFPGVEEFLEGEFPEDGLPAGSSFLVCTQGENDEQALLEAARSRAGYVGFVASRKKGNAVFKYLRDHGVPIERIKEIKTPAGIDINAKLPEEVAVSILAEIIQHHRSGADDNSANGGHLAQASANPGNGANQGNGNLYINPVCGIPVDKNAAKHIIEYNGEKVYFCCDGCKVQFEAEPEKYMG